MKGFVKKLLAGCGCCHSGPGLEFPHKEFPTTEGGGLGEAYPGDVGAPHGALFSPIAERGLVGFAQP